jgi:hypothetical protein
LELLAGAPGGRSNRPLRVIAVASSAPMRWRTSSSLKRSKRWVSRYATFL